MSWEQAQPSAGPLRFAIAERRAFAGADGRAQWRELAPADYAEFGLAANDSGTMLLPPFVEGLAGWIAAEIDTLDARAVRH